MSRKGTYLVYTVEHVDQEEFQVEILSLARVLVELGQVHQNVVVHRAIEEAHRNNRQNRPEGVPEQQVRVLEVAEKSSDSE